ncbi:hypothetical protein [Teichococcus aerophilus]|uniref:hypothetical protein n=1 Tax=Teichococcus aerophilus TaxID=1224513 RepID=UPI001F5113D3|nr:hypothetical protein [Pseudoroseomonas aerophila]
MDSLYFVAMLAGITWLAWWSSVSAVGEKWSPFEMLQDAADDTGDSSTATGDRYQRGSVRSWRDKADPVADVQHPVPKRHAAASWRVRGKPPAASRRQQ